MRALLTPDIAPGMGIVLFRPGRELLPLFRGGRVLVESEPENMAHLPSGIVPPPRQLLVDSDEWRHFLTHERTISAAGGIDGMVRELNRAGGCQWESGDYHSHLHTILRYGSGAIRLCWHCDNRLREQSLPRLDVLAAQNAAEYVISVARQQFRLPEHHQITAPELCWWAFINGLTDLLPGDSVREYLRLPPAPPLSGPFRSSDIAPYAASDELLVDHVEMAKPVLALAADDEPPAGYMRRPKLLRWECEKYTRWVKTQACSGCGQPADDPHHIINHGMGGMGTKVHDLFVIPLCRRCHDELHRDVRAWEQEHGSQIELLVRFLDRALGIGALTVGK